MGEIDRGRLCRLLDTDKEEMNAPTRAAALGAFTRIAEEYFETDGGVYFAVEQGESGLDVTVSFRALRVKNFTVLK